ncbi:glycosyl transferase family protein [Caballeronia terrestris]|uniref:Glycosyl transferase family protein n=1 Tax=Caballeronia terrestris TaxID=1226301 RepID=A0A158K3U7_9BURK|nr:glycosyltransferase family 2 protein [Caballeronia terrestris]SAL75645.1 glycosyl transferase family protein [Caballeronia terrestris]
MTAKVGIIIRTRNRPRLLQRALASVCAQSFDDWKLVIVNGGGESSPVDAIVGALPGHVSQRVQVIHLAASVGRSATGNVGFALLDTQYVATLDDDDSWQPDFLSITVDALDDARRELPSVRGVTVAVNAVEERIEGNDIHTLRVTPYNAWPATPHVVSLDAMLQGSELVPSGVLLDRRAVAEAGGLFDASLAIQEDWDLYVRFMLRWDILTIPDHAANYHRRPFETDPELANSVYTQGKQAAISQQAMLNDWLKRSVAQTGIGEYANLRQNFHSLGQIRTATAERSLNELALVSDVLATIIEQLADVDDKLAHSLPAAHAGR